MEGLKHKVLQRGRSEPSAVSMLTDIPDKSPSAAAAASLPLVRLPDPTASFPAPVWPLPSGETCWRSGSVRGARIVTQRGRKSRSRTRRRNFILACICVSPRQPIVPSRLPLIKYSLQLLCNRSLAGQGGRTEDGGTENTAFRLLTVSTRRRDAAGLDCGHTQKRKKNMRD